MNTTKTVAVKAGFGGGGIWRGALTFRKSFY